MSPRPLDWQSLDSQDDRKRAHLAFIARRDTIHGGAKALTIAAHCSRWNAEEVVSDVYSRSGRHSQRWEAWKCPECWAVWLGIEGALNCCNPEADDDFVPAECYERGEETGISDDNWACGTLDHET